MKPKLRYLYTAFSVSILILVILSYVFFQRLGNLTASSRNVEQTYKVLYHLDKVENALSTGESAVRGFLLNGDSSLLNNLDTLSSSIRSNISQLQKMLDGNPAQRRELQRLQSHISVSYGSLYRRLSLSARGSLSDAELVNARVSMDSCQHIIHRMEQSALVELRSGNVTQDFYVATTPEDFKILFIFTFIIFLVSFIFIFREYTRRMRYQGELERNVQELSRMNTELLEFSFVASHNLQEPLRKIQTFSNRLVGKHAAHLGEEGRLITERIDRLAAEMQLLMVDFVEFSSLINSSDTIEEVNLNELLNSVKAEMQPLILSSSVDLQTGKLGSVRGYRKQLQTLFRNLLDNAIKFGRPGVAPLISVNATRVGFADLPQKHQHLRADFLRVSVCDNGIGFNEAFTDKIFALFQRLDSDSNTNHGKGVGLAIVRRVMLNHHGFVTANSVPGEGATFHLFFPIA